MLHLGHCPAQPASCRGGSLLPAGAPGGDIRRPPRRMDRADGRADPSPAGRIRHTGQEIGQPARREGRRRRMVLQPAHQRGAAGNAPPRQGTGAHQCPRRRTVLPAPRKRAARGTGHHPLPGAEHLRQGLPAPHRTAEQIPEAHGGDRADEPDLSLRQEIYEAAVQAFRLDSRKHRQPDRAGDAHPQHRSPAVLDEQRHAGGDAPRTADYLRGARHLETPEEIPAEASAHGTLAHLGRRGNHGPVRLAERSHRNGPLRVPRKDSRPDRRTHARISQKVGNEVESHPQSAVRLLRDARNRRDAPAPPLTLLAPPCQQLGGALRPALRPPARSGSAVQPGHKRHRRVALYRPGLCHGIGQAELHRDRRPELLLRHERAVELQLRQQHPHPPAQQRRRRNLPCPARTDPARERTPLRDGHPPRVGEGMGGRPGIRIPLRAQRRRTTGGTGELHTALRHPPADAAGGIYRQGQGHRTAESVLS